VVVRAGYGFSFARAGYLHLRLPALAPNIFRPIPTSTAHPSPGWNAVRVSVRKIFGVPSWPDGHPQASIGRSIFLWHFRPK